MIVVKYCNINSIEDGTISHYLDRLPAFMRAEIIRYKYAEDQKARLVSRLMLQESMAETATSACLNNWRRDANNKPVIDNWHAFNISHAASMVVFAYTTSGTVGIDIEKIRALEYNDIIESFHNAEQQYITTAVKPLHSFYKIWAKKEALLKAAGIGIVNGLKDFSCVENIVNYRGQSWYLKKVELLPDYTCYLCSPEVNEHISIQEFKLLHRPPIDCQDNNIKNDLAL